MASPIIVIGMISPIYAQVNSPIKIRNHTAGPIMNRVIITCIMLPEFLLSVVSSTSDSLVVIIVSAKGPISIGLIIYSLPDTECGENCP